jgi:acetyl/propionyl-CoA carboxylase alpha subunit
VDATHAFWFIEMNARHQVEHPVTELVMGVDLVRQQIEIAAGQPLALRQADLVVRGHAVECRIYAEDPAHDFIPSTGRVTRLRPPIGPGLRFDPGYADGDTLPQFYDAMLGKLIAYAEDRPSAIARARAALDGLLVEGVGTNRALLTWVLDDAEFRSGQMTTELLATRWHPAPALPAAPLMLAAAAARELAASTRSSVAAVGGYWSIAGQGITLFLLDEASPSSRPIAVRADAAGPGAWHLTVAGEAFHAVVDEDRVRLRAGMNDGDTTLCAVTRTSDALVVQIGQQQAQIHLAGPPSAEALAGGTAAGPGGSAIRAPMPGRIVRVDVQVGDIVAEQQPLLLLEAMKIEHRIVAPRAGVVAAVHCGLGVSVVGGQLLVELGPA